MSKKTKYLIIGVSAVVSMILFSIIMLRDQDTSLTEAVADAALITAVIVVVQLLLSNGLIKE